MKWIKHLRTWVSSKINPVTDFPDIPQQIEEAFTVAGRKYYQFTDAFNMPYKRALVSINYFEETRLKADYDFIRLHQKTINELLLPDPGKPIDIFKIKQLNDQLGERLNFVMDEELLYKFASVVYFDATEDPTDYDYKYAHKKINFWRENMEASRFFFQPPILRYFPYLADLADNFPEYSTAVKEISKIHTESLRSVSSPSSTESSP